MEDWMEKLHDLMFVNVGKKIKRVVEISVKISIVLILIAAVIMEFGALIQLLNGMADNLLIMLLIPVGVVIAVFFLWLSVAVVHGFGTLVEKAEKDLGDEQKGPVYQPMYGAPQPPYAAPQTVYAPSVEPAPMPRYWVCDCGTKNREIASACSGCGKERGYKAGGDGYVKCSCGAMVPRGVCPLCGEEVY